MMLFHQPPFGAGAGAGASSPPPASELTLPPAPGPASRVSAVAFSPVEDVLVGCSWDGSTSVYRVGVDHEGRPLTQIPVAVVPSSGSGSGRGSLLDVRFVDGQTVVMGGGDGVYGLSLGASAAPFKILPSDAGAVARVRWNPSLNAVVAATWSKQLALVDPRQAGSPSALALAVDLPERAFAMDACDNRIVVGCAERHLCLYDARNPRQAVFSGFSPLRYQTRDVALFDLGYVVCGVGEPHQVALVFHGEESTPPNPNTKSFSWSCSKTNEPVNAVAFRPTTPTILATAGANGNTNVWSWQWKTRQLAFKAKAVPSPPPQVTALSFSRSGTLLAAVKSTDPLNPLNAAMEVTVHWVGQRSVSQPKQQQQQQASHYPQQQQQQHHYHQNHHHHHRR